MTQQTGFLEETKHWLDVFFGWTRFITRRLGRHEYFDEKSKTYRAITPEVERTLKTKMWQRDLPPLNQGRLGSCTGNSCVGLLATEPNCSDGVADNVKFDQDLAVKIYSKATEIDLWPGTYPPTDTGSSVLATMRVAKKLGLISEYRWCFGVEEVLIALSHIGPVAIGVKWYKSFQKPDCNGFVKIEGTEIRGGHAFELIGIDVEKRVVWAVNSWGKFWGKDGRFCFSFEDLDRLLKERGEAVMIKTR